MIPTIRASKLFSWVPEQHAKDRITQMKIPIRRMPDQSDYSLKLLELMVLTACIRITKAKRMFEFGTFLGNTTLHMALNSSEDAEIWTLDADDGTLGLLGLLETYQWRDRFPLEFAGTQVENKIHVLREDSHAFEPGKFAGTMDLILIDGDHSGEGVEIDTVNALRMLKCTGCILWHDYRDDPGCAENVSFLDGLSKDMGLAHIQDTSLVVALP